MEIGQKFNENAGIKVELTFLISGNHASKNCFDPRSSGKMEISRLDVCRSLVHRTSVLYFAVKRHHLFHLLLYEVFGFFLSFYVDDSARFGNLFEANAMRYH